MAERTGIEWADATWNPWMGCKKVSAGCKNCYMFRDMTFYGRDPNIVIGTSQSTFTSPLKWARQGKMKARSRIFTCSWSDFFIEQADGWRNEAWDIIRRTPQFNYLILTKRPGLIGDRLPADWGRFGYRNVWLGVSAENQMMAKERIPILLTVPAHIRWVSAEPLLGPIDFEDCVGHLGIDWIVTGGESDKHNPRPCNLDWVRSIRTWCELSGTAFFHKQNGGMKKLDGAWGGRLLDGVTHDQFPAHGGVLI